MSENPPTYEVGQIVNGHRWNGTSWEPVTAAEATTATQPTIAQPDPSSYQVGQVVNGHQWNGSAWVPVGAVATAAPITAAVTTTQKAWYTRWWVWVIGVVGLLLVIGIATQGSNPSSNTTVTPTPTASIPAPPSDSPSTPAASQPPAESPTPTQTSTPAPVDPLAGARAAFAEAYGTFAPIKKSGRGDSVVRLPANVQAGIAAMSYKGSSNFIIETLDASNQSTGFALANEIGSWKGASAFGLDGFGEQATKLKITATGSWAITIYPVASAPAFKVPGSYEGTRVYLYGGDVADWTFTHKGRSNFIVTEYAPGESGNNLINEIGRYNGTVPGDAGPQLVTVQADGAWTVK